MPMDRLLITISSISLKTYFRSKIRNVDQYDGYNLITSMLVCVLEYEEPSNISLP